MVKIDPSEIKWKDWFDDSDLDAARDYLALRLTPARAEKIVTLFKDATMEKRRVADLLRACDREPLPLSDRGVRWKLDRALAGKKLTPALVVSFDGVGGDVAQGFHSLSLACALDPRGQVPVVIAYEGGSE